MIRTTFIIAMAFVASISLELESEAVTFTEIARFDVSDASADTAASNYIGNNPSAVAWDGSQLYVAGFNSGGPTAGIVEITNATSTGINAATFGSAFGSYATPNSRGYSGLDLEAGVLAAAYDDGGADANGIQAFDTATNSQTWAKSARGGSGVGHDPGFGGADAGVAWLTFGSGRRPLQDTATGADIYTTGSGMIITDFGGSFWRDIDFDQSTGDVYMRRANDLVKATRTGGNSATVSVIADTNENGPFTAGQNVDFIASEDFGDVVIYNDRPNTNTGSFADIVNVIDSAGASLSSTFHLIGGGTIADGTGYYDFDFDTASQTLAVMDFSNRNVHIFQLAVPEPGAVCLLAIGALGLLGTRRS